MGVVYKTRHVPLNRIVALKMIKAGDLASDEEVVISIAFSGGALGPAAYWFVIATERGRLSPLQMNFSKKY